MLRKDASLIPQIEKSFVQTKRAIDDYPRDGLFQDEDDETYLIGLSQALEQYAVNLKYADFAMYQAKKAGKNCYKFLLSE